MANTTHTVRRGETLGSIAKRYACSTDELASANRIKNKNTLSVGQTLTIPNTRAKDVPDAPVPPPDKQAPPADSKQRSRIDELHDALVNVEEIATGIFEGLLRRLRTTESNESNQHEADIPVSPTDKPVTPPPKEPPGKKNSKGKQSISQVKAKLKESLGREPHVVTFRGVKLTENEKKQIMASVATCEMNADGFGSMNADQEFVGRKFGKKGIEIGSGSRYSRIVHVGLSYGIIQYTQDSGSLGVVLSEMSKKNRKEFIRIFGGQSEEVADNLLELVTNGKRELAASNIPICGLVYWQKLSKTQEGKELYDLANRDDDRDGKSDLPTHKEIRGKRVQPIPPNPGGTEVDLWIGEWKDRFLEAGNVTDFQEVQIELAVKNYMNPILKKAQSNNVRSAIGLAFITACAVRGGPQSKLTSLLYRVAEQLEVAVPFLSADDEIKCVKAIADKANKNSVGKVSFDQDERRRAELLLRDELGFLAEDLYDTSTYI